MAAAEKDTLRFITCGSVDDGKSTLLGRLLNDTASVLQDQMAAAKNESRKFGTQGDQVDLALLIDGLQAEREQGITIDVAYRYFETDTRKFIAADTPGHKQYTRNMATGASNAELAIILVDARKGLLEQTRRHSHIAALFGIRQIVLAVNKMDQVDWNKNIFRTIEADYRAFCEALGFTSITAIPLSALSGENVVERGAQSPWYGGIPLVNALEEADVSMENVGAFRLPVQWVNRPSPDFRGFSGLIASGEIALGDRVVASLSGRDTTVKGIFAPGGEVERACAGQSITLTLDDELDISRGDVIAKTDKPPEVADQFAAKILWMDGDAMLPERRYRVRFASAEANGRITDLTYKIDVNTRERLAAKQLEINELAYCKIAMEQAVAIDAYSDNRQTGSFIIIDRDTNRTVGAGAIEFALRRSTNIEWQRLKVDRFARSKMNDQKPVVLWFTGLSGSGKSTIADLLEQKLYAMGRRTYLLDGDNVRHGLNKDLGFTNHDRVENIRRVAEVARLMVDAGLIVLTAFISPFRAERRMARDLMGEGDFLEIHVNTPLEVCEARDPKGLYAKARAGKLKNFTGIDSDYEIPERADLVLDGANQTPELLAEEVLNFLRSREESR